MLKLCGFALSNYYNKVKFALLEKNIAFTEDLTKVGPWAVPGLVDRTPFGKVPFIETAQGTLCESQVIMDYIEQQWPTPALMPTDAWQAAKVRELITCMEIHLELAVREHYPHAYFGAPPMGDSSKARVHKLLTKNVEGFKRLIKNTDLSSVAFITGDVFTQADCAAFVHLPLIGMTTKIAYGSDMLVDMGVDWKPYVKRLAERPAAQRVDADRKAYQAAAQAAATAKV
jgi:glutathione S-transferase